MQGLSKQLAYILAAGGPQVQLARVRWPLHLALREAVETAGRLDELEVLDLSIEFRPSPDHGIEAVGADAALEDLVQAGVLIQDGERREAVLVLDAAARIQLRRELMALPPQRVRLYQRAGTRWATLAATAAKNRSTPARSSGSTLTSATPKRAKVSLPVKA
jgi:hypothetical protein